jgi:hypothetical protein
MSRLQTDSIIGDIKMKYSVGTRVVEKVGGNRKGTIISYEEFKKNRIKRNGFCPKNMEELIRFGIWLPIKLDLPSDTQLYWIGNKEFWKSVEKTTSINKVEQIPPNNDGRNTCCQCGAATEKIQGFDSLMDVCTQCKY